MALALGNQDINYEWGGWNWFVFIISAITLVIVMLNMLISIVGKTFEKFQEDKEIIDLEESLNMLYEFNKLFYLYKNDDFQPQYFQFVEEISG